ncbi:MAG: hypothetical protein JWL97_2422 [Gemmatimonadales bacterium]|nr:hypothetical protein [Gemmatimonadales bacterium]
MLPTGGGRIHPALVLEGERAHQSFSVALHVHLGGNCDLDVAEYRDRLYHVKPNTNDSFAQIELDVTQNRERPEVAWQLPTAFPLGAAEKRDDPGNWRPLLDDGLVGHPRLSVSVPYEAMPGLV